MSKLQQIKRVNQSLSHSVNIPLDVIEETGWEKGDNLTVKCKIDPDGGFMIVIQNEDDN